MFIVFKVSCDGGQLGRMWRYKVCNTAGELAQTINEFTEPESYVDGPAKYEQETVEDKQGWACWRASKFVYFDTL